MATPKDTTVKRGRIPRMRTNLVTGEDAAGAHHCLYVGPSADDALRVFAQIRQNGGSFEARQFVRAALFIDPRTSKHSSFAV